MAKVTTYKEIHKLQHVHMLGFECDMTHHRLCFSTWSTVGGVIKESCRTFELYGFIRAWIIGLRPWGYCPLSFLSSWLYGLLKCVQAPLARLFMCNGLYISYSHEKHGPSSLQELLFRYLLTEMRKKINKLCNWASTALPVSFQIIIWWLLLTMKACRELHNVTP